MKRCIFIPCARQCDKRLSLRGSTRSVGAGSESGLSARLRSSIRHTLGVRQVSVDQVTKRVNRNGPAPEARAAKKAESHFRKSRRGGGSGGASRMCRKGGSSVTLPGAGTCEWPGLVSAGGRAWVGTLTTPSLLPSGADGARPDLTGAPVTNSLPPEVGRQMWELRSGGPRRFSRMTGEHKKPLSQLAPDRGERLNSLRI